MISSEYYKNIAKKSLDDSINLSSRKDTYFDVSNESIKNVKDFTERLTESFNKIFIRLNEEEKNVKQSITSLNDASFIAKSIIERRRRCAIGCICSPCPLEKFEHFSDSNVNQDIRIISKLCFEPAKLAKYNCASARLEDKKIDLKELYQEESQYAIAKTSYKLNGISSKKIQNTICSIFPSSSFWNTSETLKLPFKIATAAIPINSVLFQNLILAKNIEYSTYLTTKTTDQGTGEISKSSNVNREASLSHNPSRSSKKSLPVVPSKKKMNSKDNLSSDSQLTLPICESPGSSSKNSCTLTNTGDSDGDTLDGSLLPPPPDFLCHSGESENDNLSQDKMNTSDVSSSAGNMTPKPLYSVKAMYKFVASNTMELSFEADDVIDILEEHPNLWDVGILNQKKGFVPRNYVKKL